MTPADGDEPGRAGSVLVVTDSRRLARREGLQITSVQDYLDGEGAEPDLFCVNLCREFTHRRNGYYVSLIAGTRSQAATPSSSHIEDLIYRSYYLRVLQEAGIPTASLKVSAGARWVPRIEVDSNGRIERLTVRSVFGRTVSGRLGKLARRIHACYPVPLLEIDAYRRLAGRDRRWKVSRLSLASPEELDDAEFELLVERLRGRVRRPRPPARRDAYLWLACLWDPDETLKPSHEETLERFERIASRRSVHFNLVTFDELARLPEYDALFIRTTTGIDNRTFEFAKMAEAFGMPVIDDTESIVRCGDKVFLYEAFKLHEIPTPDTIVVQRRNAAERLRDRSYPAILKSPAGSFSRAVKKARDPEEAMEIAATMFSESSIVIVQEFVPTPFDWRIGILDGDCLYACRYHMAYRHWQILREVGGRFLEGKVEAVPLDQVPRPVLRAARRAAGCIGRGLYGVDLKEGPGGPLVMEVNDNPDLHVGYEDGIEGDAIYERIVDEFVRRVRASRRSS